jgi:hypothetical protein
MSEILTPEQIAEFEAQSGQKAYHVRDRALGSILFGLPSEEDFRAYKREINRAVLQRTGDVWNAEKNLVSSCLLHPTPKAYFAAVEQGRQFGLTSRLARKIFELAGGDDAEDEGKE